MSTAPNTHAANGEAHGASRATPRSDNDSATETSSTVPSPFAPERLRLAQDFGSATGVKKVTKTVPARKPNKHEWVRVHPSEDWRLSPVAALNMKDENVLYLVSPDVASTLPPGEMTPMALRAAITRQGVFFIWPLRLGGAEGRHDEWARSAIEAADAAEDAWVRVVANTHLGAYETYSADASLAEPEWPSDIPTFERATQIAFRDRFITTVDHPVLRRLRGEL